VEVRATLRNFGGEIEEIVSIQPSCGCSAAVASEMTLLPGATSDLRITVNPLKVHGDELNEAVTLTMASGQELVLSIGGVLPRCAEIDASPIDLGDIVVEEPPTMPNIERVWAEKILHRLQPTFIRSLSGGEAESSVGIHLTASSFPGNLTTYTLAFGVTSPEGKLGMREEKVLAKLGDGAETELTFIWRATSNVLRTPQLPIHFGVVQQGQTKAVEVELHCAAGEIASISTREGSPFAAGALAKADGEQGGPRLVRVPVSFIPTASGRAVDDLWVNWRSESGEARTYRVPLLGIGI